MTSPNLKWLKTAALFEGTSLITLVFRGGRKISDQLLRWID